MGWTKAQFIAAAFEELGLASYAFDLSADQTLSAARRLDAMMAEWNAKGIRVGYPIENPDDVTLSTNTRCPDSANQAIITNLAMILAPSVGRQPMDGTKATAKASYNTLLSLAAIPPTMQFPETLPTGAGNKPWRTTGNAFFPTPEDRLSVGPDSDLDLD